MTPELGSTSLNALKKVAAVANSGDMSFRVLHRQLNFLYATAEPARPQLPEPTRYPVGHSDMSAPQMLHTLPYCV